MNWSNYENQVFEVCKLYFPDAKISRDIKLVGKYSKRKRQIDILIEEKVGGNIITILVDCKLYNKKIDVKSVESLIGMVEDVGADKGLMITEKGYTLAALKRAYYNPKHIELDIYSLKELQSVFHGESAIPYAGLNGVLLLAPFGWIVDSTSRDGSICMLYQRGLTITEATKQKELAYVNYWDRKKDNFNLNDLVKYQEEYMLETLDIRKITYQESIKREDGKTLIRIADVKKYPGLEITGFIEFEDFIFFCVWFSPEILLKRNIRKIESLMKSVKLVNMEEVLQSNYVKLEEQIQKTEGVDEKANILFEQGKILRILGKYQQAYHKHDECTKLVKGHYGAMKGKVIAVLLMELPYEKYSKLIDSFFDLGPTNPQVCQDLISMFSDYKKIPDLLDIFSKKSLEYANNPEARGNISYHSALIYLGLNEFENARKHFESAKDFFSSSKLKDNSVLKYIDKNLKTITKIINAERKTKQQKKH